MGADSEAAKLVGVEGLSIQCRCSESSITGISAGIFTLNAAIEPSPAEPEPKVHDRLSQAGMLLLQGFAPHPTYYAPKIFV